MKLFVFLIATTLFTLVTPVAWEAHPILGVEVVLGYVFALILAVATERRRKKLGAEKSLAEEPPVDCWNQVIDDGRYVGIASAEHKPRVRGTQLVLCELRCKLIDPLSGALIVRASDEVVHAAEKEGLEVTPLEHSEIECSTTMQVVGYNVIDRYGRCIAVDL